MATPAVWAYSNWITFPTGSAQRLTALRLHIQELTDFLRGYMTQEYAVRGRQVDPKIAEVQKELDSLRKTEQVESEMVDLQSGRRLGFTKGRPRL